MSALPCPTPSEARRLWEGMARPSSRRVARKLRQAGRPVSHETVNRWRRQGWRPVEQEPQHPLEAARDDLDDALPLLTGDPMSTAASFVQQSGKRESLEEWTDDALLHQSAREVLITVAIIARAMMVKPMLAVAKPAETGILVRALAGCLKAATAVLSERPTGNPRK
jgi:hypothetical protein